MAGTAFEVLGKKRDELRKEVAAVGDMRPGSLVERYRRCRKPGCHCAKEGYRGHGPSWSLTHAVSGKTVTTIIPADAVDQARHDIAEYQRFRGFTRDLVDVSERLCDARLEAAKTASGEAVRKGLFGGSRGGAIAAAKGWADAPTWSTHGRASAQRVGGGGDVVARRPARLLRGIDGASRPRSVAPGAGLAMMPASCHVVFQSR